MIGACYHCHGFSVFSSKQNISFHSITMPFRKYAKFHENPLQSHENTGPQTYQKNVHVSQGHMLCTEFGMVNWSMEVVFGCLGQI